MTDTSEPPVPQEPGNASETLGIVEEERREGWSRVRMPIRQRHLRRKGVPDSGVQGGMVVSLADHAFTYASFSVLPPGHLIATIELKVNFIAQATRGDLIAECRIIHRGKRTFVGEFEVTDHTGRLIARGMGTNLLLEQ